MAASLGPGRALSIDHVAKAGGIAWKCIGASKSAPDHFALNPNSLGSPPEEKVRELTVGIGVDHVVEVGGAGTFNQSLKSVRLGGRISLIGVLAGKGDVNLTPVLMKAVCVQGIFVGSRAMFEAMNRAIASEKLRPVVDRVFAFDEIQAALRHMESGAHFGKVCLRRS